jgi:hypothetical protein
MMLLGEVKFDALTLLHPWLQEVGVRPFESSSNIQQAFLRLFPICSQPRSLHVHLVLCMLVQGTLPPL